MAPCCLTRPALLLTEVIHQNTKTMNSNTNIEQVLNTERLTESQHVATFADELPRDQTVVKVGDTHVALHSLDDSAIIVVDYIPGRGRDTAFVGGLEDAHSAVVRLAAHADATVILDRFDVLEEGDRR